MSPFAGVLLELAPSDAEHWGPPFSGNTNYGRLNPLPAVQQGVPNLRYNRFCGKLEPGPTHLRQTRGKYQRFEIRLEDRAAKSASRCRLSQIDYTALQTQVLNERKLRDTKYNNRSSISRALRSIRVTRHLRAGNYIFPSLSHLLKSSFRYASCRCLFALARSAR